jgi:hypothetical protein
MPAVSKLWKARAPALFLLLGGGCDAGFKPPAYQEAPTIYACVGFADAKCDGMFPALSPLTDGLSDEAPIVLGGQFGIAQGLTLTPSRLTELRANVFQANIAGLGTVLAGHTGVPFEVRAPADIRISHEIDYISGTFSQIYGSDNFALRIPDRFRAVPIDTEGNMLAGDIGCSWTTSNPGVVTIESDPSKNIVTFRIQGPGNASLHVQMGSMGKDVAFNIQGP